MLAENDRIRESVIREELGNLNSDRSRRRFFDRHPSLVSPMVVEDLCTEVPHLLCIDHEQARELAATAYFVAEALDDDYSRARSARASANVYQSSGQSERAQDLYDQALELFTRLGDDREAAITRSSALLNLGYLGKYELVLEWEEAARDVFEKLSDRLRLAILEHNFAIILYRQDRWEIALQRFDFAYKEFMKLGRSQDAAICLRNIAVCYISLHNFDEALSVYERTRTYCEQEGLDRLVLELDLNIASLFHQRGQYTRAIKLFEKARRKSRAESDEYSLAVCDLEQSEIYLELNLVDEAAKLAHSAYLGFSKQHRAYEYGKALTNSALALSRQGKGILALDQLQQAREIFVREKNQVWPAMIDFYQAFVLYRERRPSEAMSLAEAARETFTRSAISSKAVLCELLLAELLLDLGKPEEARRTCYESFARLKDLELPALEHRAYLVLGRVEETLADRPAALQAYQESLRWLEKLRSQLQDEDLKIHFLDDKGVVYESLVWLTMQDRTIAARETVTFDLIEQARSRSLADMMAFRAYALPSKTTAEGEPLVVRMRGLREELNWFYRQIDRQQMSGEERALEEVQKIRKSIRGKEDSLLRTLRELQATDEEFSSLQSGGGIDLANIRSSLPERASLVEYFIARDTVFACVLDKKGLEIQALTSAKRTQEIHRRLQFQLSRSTISDKEVTVPMVLVEQATRSHLRDLEAELIGPIRDRLRGEQLVIVPHGFLHHVPFHALFDGESHLIDQFSISYAPSASVLHLCLTKEVGWEDRSLVLGVADERAPFIKEEVQAVAEALPDVTLLIDEDANEKALQRLGATSRFVHIASHGLFRRDNPMFSSIQLGSSRLSLFDLYNLRLSAELVVLSGCGTGLNAVLGSDELVGLTRGLLYAGAHSVLVSLWDVHDASTTFFMRRFYHHLARGPERAAALQRTMLDVRARFPSPYHWAPFVLIGKPRS